jgi:hypothetical protein
MHEEAAEVLGVFLDPMVERLDFLDFLLLAPHEVHTARCPVSKSVVAYRKPSTNSHMAAWGRRGDSESEVPD